MESDMDWTARIIRGICEMHMLNKPFKEWPIELQIASMWSYTYE